MTHAFSRRDDDESCDDTVRRPDDARSTPMSPSHPHTRARRLGVVLIVDDTADTRDLYSLYFRSLGFTVITAPDGVAALDAAATQHPDVVVMDLSMPRMDGVTAIRRMRQDPRSQDIPVILLTGYPERAIGYGALEAGAAALLTKPCLPEELATHVRRLLPGSEAST